MRGLILALARHASGGVALEEINALWPDPDQLDRALTGLLADGLLVRTAPDSYGLPGLT